MAKKRIEKKREKEKLIKEVGERQRLAGKKVTSDSLSYNELKKKQDTYVKRKQKRERNLNKKKQYLLDNGVDLWGLSDSQINKIKIKDIEENNVNEYTYPKIYKNDGMLSFDFNKKYKWKNNQRLFLAYKDFQGEQSLESLLSMYANMNNIQLLTALKEIALTPMTYGKRGDTSSGSAGEAILKVTNQKAIQGQIIRTINDNKKNRSKWDKFIMEHKGHKPADYQFLTDSKGRKSQDTYTPRNLLILMNAILHNVTENNRASIYAEFYDTMLIHNEEFDAILPKPRY